MLFQKEKVDTGTLTELAVSSFSRRCNLLRLEEKTGSDRQPVSILCVNTKDLSFIIGINNAAKKALHLSLPPLSTSIQVAGVEAVVEAVVVSSVQRIPNCPAEKGFQQRAKSIL